MLTSKTKYALRALTNLARRGASRPVLIADLASEEKVPQKFLERILHELKLRGLLESRKGRGGGYQLVRPASEVRVGDIVRWMDGPLAPVPCVSKTAYRRCRDCPDEGSCCVRLVMKDVRDAIARILDGTTLADVAARADEMADGKAERFVYEI